MKHILVLVGCLLVASADADYGWRPKQEYRFSIEGRSITGIPSLKHQYSGIHVAGNLRVQAQSPEILMMKLQNMTFTKIHTHLARGWWQPVSQEDQVYQEFPISTSPFIARLQKGVVERLVVSGDLETWEVNFIQAVVGHLQLDLSMSHNTGTPTNRNQKRPEDDATVFTVMENSVVGRCEVLYEITPKTKTEITMAYPNWMTFCGKNRDFLEITKTYNYSNCDYLAESHFGLPHTMTCSPSGNECGTFWSRSAMSHSLGCGDRRDLFVLSTVSSARVMVALRMQPEDSTRGRPNSQAMAGTYLNITLLSAHTYDPRRRFGQPSNPVNIDGIRYQHGAAPHLHLSEEDDHEKSKRKTSKKVSAGSSVSSSEEKHRFRRSSRKNRHHPKAAPAASPEMANISPESISSEHSVENMRPWGQSKNDDMNKPPLMPFSAFSLAHREGEARACLVQQLKEIITDIANDMDVPKVMVEKMTLEKIHIAIEMCRTMTYPELLRGVSSIMNSDARETRILLTERKILRDVVIMCGTKPAFRIIKAWLEQRKVRGEAAAEMIAALPSYLLSPSPALIQQFYELVRDYASSEDQQVKISSILAFSHLLRVSCVNKASRKARFPEPYQPCRTENATQYLTYLARQMTSDPSLRRVYMTAIGNTAASTAMPVLLAVARDPSVSPYQRASAILATRYIVFKNPGIAVKTLLSFYHSSKYPTAVRIAALSLLFYTRPPLVIWQRIATSTWYEPNSAINAYVWSTLNNLASTQDPFYKTMTERAIAVLPLARPVPLGAHRPYNLVRTAVTSGLHEVVVEQLSWNSDLSAANIYYRQTQRLGGYSRLHFEADFWMADADGFIEAFAHMLKPSEKVEKVRPPIRDLPRSTHLIRETLKIVTREQPRIEGHLGFKLGALHERMFPFDSRIVSNIEKASRRLLEQFKSSKPLLYQKLGQSGFWMGTTNELGFPMTFKLSVPWGVRAKGEVNGSNDTSLLAVDVALMYTSQLIAELSVYTPFDCLQYVAGAQSHTFMQLPPMRLSARLPTKSNKKLQFKFSSLSPSEESLLFSQISQPYTSQHDVISLTPISNAKTTITVSVAPQLKSEMLQGTPLKLEYSSEAPNHRWSPEPHWVLNYPALWPGLEAASLKLIASRPVPLHLNFTLSHARAENGEVVISRDSEVSPSPTPVLNSTLVPYTTTPYYERATSEGWSSTTPSSIEVNPQVTFMEEMLNPNLTILTSRVEDPIGSFNASTLNLLTLESSNMSRSDYILRNILSEMNNGAAYVIGLDIATNYSETPRYHASWSLAAGRARRFHRAGLFIMDDVDKWQFGVTSVLQIPKVPMLSLKSILDANLTSNLFIDFKHTTKVSSDMISVKGSIMRTESHTNYVRNNSMTVECLQDGLNVQPGCRRMALEAGYLDRYNLTITYNENAQQYGTPAQHYFNLIKHSMFPYMAEDLSIVDNEITKNRVRLVAELNPASHTAALWMRTPLVEAELNGMPINNLLLQTLRVNPIVGFLPKFKDPSFCGIESNRVSTFDGSRYIYALNNCWHVLAKDCSGGSRVVILARNSSSKHLEVEVNVDNHKVIWLGPNGEAMVNGVKVDLRYDQIAEAFDQAASRLLELTCTADDTLKLRLPVHGITLLLGNNTLLIQATAGLRGRLCGMCGDFDGEVEGDFRGPAGNIILPPREFAKSYALPCRNKD